MAIVVPSTYAPAQTSGTYLFTVTQSDIVKQAMVNIGALDAEETPTPQEYSDVALWLNMMTKQWQGTSDFAPGLKTWTQQLGYLFLHSTTGVYQVGPGATGWTNGPFTLQASTATAVAGATTIVVPSVLGIALSNYIGVQLDSGDITWSFVTGVSGTTLSFSTPLPSQASANAQVVTYATAAQSPVTISTVVLRDAQSNDTPVRLLTVQDYDLLPGKTQPTNISDPGAIYFEWRLNNSNIYTDVAGAQDTTKYLVIRYLEPIQDITNPANVPEYPWEWYLPIVLGLSKLICPQFKRVWTPVLESNYVLALEIARKKGPERSTMFFQPGNDE